ncbi:MAG: hypothetical protein RIR34_648 [Actinomycetota bacterium]
MRSLFWFTKDLRLQDNKALNAAVAFAQSQGGNEAGGNARVSPFYALISDEFLALSGVRQHSLVESLRALDDSLQGNLGVVQAADRAGIPGALARAVASTNSDRVYATRLFDPAGQRLQNTVGRHLASLGIALILEDSQYAVAPGAVRKPDGTPYRVYTPYQKLWMQTGWDKPQTLPTGGFSWFKGASDGIPTANEPAPFKIIAGEAYALRTWERFKERALFSYDENRNRADISGTSHLSHALAHGEIHPRTLLAELREVPGHEVFRKELAWREFYADVLFHNPHTETDYYDAKFARMRYDWDESAREKLAAWQAGKTGYPMVDAGMRQLLQTGWMHNRVRMIVASFLVKDLHIEWQHGATWFEQHLTDFDPASNAHGWQWTAGCGTDASPYYRVFNPVGQGLKFDPNGDYVRKYVPELRHLTGADVHEPWSVLGGYDGGYPLPIVDHAVEREESLRRLEELKL